MLRAVSFFYFAGMQNNILHLSEGSLAYHEYGNGAQIWIALHGFAQEGSVFAALQTYLPTGITLIALDLPWHGASEWKEPVFLLKTIQQTIEMLLAKKQVETYTLLGFSFGARLALALAPLEAQRWRKLILLAPDGLPRRDWYAFFDQMPWWAKQGLSGLFDRSPLLLKVAEKMYRWKWLDAFSMRFMRQHLKSDASRQRLKGIWLSAALFPELQQSCQVLAQTKLDVRLITGGRDVVIPAEAFAHLAKQIPRMHWIEVKNAGHELLSAAILPMWISLLFQDTYPDTHPK